MKPLVIFTTLLIEKSPQALPLGAACIASAVKNSPLTKNLCDVKLVSFCKEDEIFIRCNDDLNKQADLITQNLLLYKPQIVGFSIFVWNRVILEKVAIGLKKNGVKIIVGGPEVTANPSSFSDFDYVICGEGESKTPSVIKKLISGEEDFSCTNVNSLETENLPSPYLDGTLDPAEFGGALWELARGCPFKCSYCYESKGEKSVRQFPMQRIEKELDLFAKKNIPQVFVLDPTYNANKKRAIQLLNLIAKKTPNTFYYFEARAEFLDREIAHAFTKIPCSLQIGLQSSDENVLRLVNRPFDRKNFTKKIGILNDEGVIFGLDLIYGLPSDTLKGFKNSVDYAISLYPNNLEIFCLSVLPGTDLFERTEELHLTFDKNPPYNVIHTDKFSVQDISVAGKIARACSVFYNFGRAVPWFNIICKTLKMNANDFFLQFDDFLCTKENYAKNEFNNEDFNSLCKNHLKVEELQINFVKEMFTKRGLKHLILLAKDIICLNGAISRKTESGITQTVELNYPIEYLESEYIFDLHYFVKNVRQKKGRYNI